MVGVPVSPVRIERKHHLRLEPANMLDNPADGLRWLGLIELAVRVVQKYNLSQAQHLSGGPEFSFALAAKGLRAGISFRLAQPASLAPRRGQKISFDPFGGVFSQAAAHPQ